MYILLRSLLRLVIVFAVLLNLTLYNFANSGYKEPSSGILESSLQIGEMCSNVSLSDSHYGVCRGCWLLWS